MLQNGLLAYFTHVQTCNATRVQSATEWTASVHTLDMSKPVMYPVFKVLRNGLLRYILYTCPNLSPLHPILTPPPLPTLWAVHLGPSGVHICPFPEFTTPVARAQTEFFSEFAASSNLWNKRCLPPRTVDMRALGVAN